MKYIHTALVLHVFFFQFKHFYIHNKNKKTFTLRQLSWLLYIKEYERSSHISPIIYLQTNPKFKTKRRDPQNMISMMYSQSFGTSMAAIVLYTCILIPLREIKRTLLSMIGRYEAEAVKESCNRRRFVVPVGRCEDLQSYSEDDDMMCSICLVELGKEDAVCQLSRCNHVFHMECIEKWIKYCDQFTCPLCRSIVFSLWGNS